jgi:NAD(P)H-dependent FMN reductase
MAALLSASPGLLGGVKSQLSLQIVLAKLGVHVIPDSFAPGATHQAFDAQRSLRDVNVEKAVRSVGAALVSVVSKFVASDRGSVAA